MTMRKFVLFCSLILILLVSSNSAKAAQPVLPSPNEVISLINQYRQQNGVPALAYNALLANLAQSQSNYQAQISTITHSGPGGTTPQERAAAAGYGDGYFYLSEIIYGGMNATPSTAIAWWKNSSLHNSIMLDPKYTEIGAGVATDGESTYFTAELGGPTGGSGSPSTNPTQPPENSGENPIPTDPSSVTIPVVKSTPGPDGAVHHIVQQGQTLWTIAAIYDTTTDLLIELNQLESSFIFPGNELLIIPPSEAKSFQPTATPTIAQSEVSATPESDQSNKPMLGTPFSLIIAQPTKVQGTNNQPTSEPAHTPVPASQTNKLEGPIVNTLLIAAVVIMVLVVLVSGFSQNKPDRPTRDDPVK